MNMLSYILIIIIFILVIVIVSMCKKLNYICRVIDDILEGNLNQRIRFQNHIGIIKKTAIKINNLMDKFQSLNEKNKTSEEERKKMISNISHDLRTPLTSMLGYMELILEDDEVKFLENIRNKDTYEINSKQNKYLQIIYNKGIYLYDLLEEFFQFSKLDSDDIKMDIREVNVSEITRNNILSFYNEINKKSIKPEINMPEEDVYAMADEKSLNGILINLINNALKHGKNADTIGIDLAAYENEISISIWNNGAGIPKEDIKQIFNRLYTGDKSRRINLKGSGLGLTIVKKLVEALNGTISVTSEDMKKTSFTFTLPRKLRDM